MPRTRVVFFEDENGKAPVLEWLLQLREFDTIGWTNCRARIVLLTEFGHELRRPAADYLRDGIYELRAKHGHVQYRMLYFFHGRNVAILAHAISKKDEIATVEIERALKRKKDFEIDPKKHTYKESR